MAHGGLGMAATMLPSAAPPAEGRVTKWHSLIAALWASITCGFLYTFSTFSRALKVEFGLSESEVSTIGMAQMVMGLVTCTAGLLVDRAGVQATLFIGVLVNSGSWWCFGLIANRVVHVSSPALVFSGLIATATFGGACMTAAIFTVLANNFGEQRATPIGIAKAWVGVAAGIATELFLGLCPSDDDAPERLHYIWFLAVTCAAFPLLAAPFLRVLPAPRHSGSDGLCVPEAARLRVLMVATFVLIVFVAAAALVHDAVRGAGAGLAVGICALMASPLLLLCPAQRRAATSPAELPVLGAAESAAPPQPRATSPWACRPLQMMRRLDAWLLWVQIFAVLGGGAVLTTNLGSITAARSGPPVSAGTAVATFSCCQGLGRLFGGTASDRVVGRGAPRTWCTVLLLALMGAAHGLICAPGPAPLLAGVALAGFAFGSMFPVMMVVIAELFGTERFASNYMVFDGWPVAVASIFVGKLLAQKIYAANSPPGQATCVGDGCFRATHALVAALQLAVVPAAVALAVRSRAVYRAILGPPKESQAPMVAGLAVEASAERQAPRRRHG